MTGRHSVAAALLGALVWSIAGASPVRAQDQASMALEHRLTTAETLDRADDERVRGDLVVANQFYAARGFAPIWTGSSAAEARGRLLGDTLIHADREGLDPSAYGATRIAALAARPDPAAATEREFLLTINLLRYAQDVRVGRVEPDRFGDEVRLTRKHIDKPALLAAAATTPDMAGWLATLPPRSDRYHRLRDLLARLRETASRGGWTRVPDAQPIKPGAVLPAVAALRARLVAAGDLAPTAATGLTYDATAQAAMRRFQARHGLDPDGVVGRNSFIELNTPVARRIEQAILNLERRRYFPDYLGDRYVFVNIADFELKVVDTDPATLKEKTLFDSKVVVGAPYHQTPIFSADMTYVEVNPYWTVPPSIAVKEMLPKLRQDPGYLAKNHLVLLSGWTAEAKPVNPRSIDWKTVRAGHFPWRIRQEPGDDNALGHIKFMLPNQFDVYLHDTPAKSLFARSSRAFSHGCIRVGDPFDLGALLLGPAGYTRARLDALRATNQRTVIRLKAPVPVYLTYLTAWVDKDGTVQYRNDVYGRDLLLASLLSQKH
jgi:murein L,D-transpeptidase YcbB/YkuD